MKAVNVIYTLCYCSSQLCNNLQVNHCLYLYISQEGLDTESYLGNTCHRKTTASVMDTLTNSHPENLDTFFLKLSKTSGYQSSSSMILLQFIQTGASMKKKCQMSCLCVPLLSNYSNISRQFHFHKILMTSTIMHSLCIMNKNHNK